MEESTVIQLYQFIANYTAYRHLYGHLIIWVFNWVRDALHCFWKWSIVEQLFCPLSELTDFFEWIDNINAVIFFVPLFHLCWWHHFSKGFHVGAVAHHNWFMVIYFHHLIICYKFSKSFFTFFDKGWKFIKSATLSGHNTKVHLISPN